MNDKLPIPIFSAPKGVLFLLSSFLIFFQKVDELNHKTYESADDLYKQLLFLFIQCYKFRN